MNSKIKIFAYTLVAIAVWITVWEISAFTLDLQFVFPRFGTTALTLFNLIVTEKFWRIIFASVARIFIGFLIGAILGVLLSYVTHISLLAKKIISPAMTTIKSTPVASFILVLWCIIGRDYVPTVIGVLMVAPIVWQNLSDGFSSVNNELVEICKIYDVNNSRKIKILILIDN